MNNTKQVESIEATEHPTESSISAKQTADSFQATNKTMKDKKQKFAAPRENHLLEIKGGL